MEHYDEVVEIKRKPKNEGRPRADFGGPGRAVLEQIDDSERITTKRPGSSLPKGVKAKERVTSESESSDTGTDENAKTAVDGFDYTVWANLDVPKDIKDLFQYIAR